MSRAIILVLDSFGLGATQDAAEYNDVGADTLGHIADNATLHLPNMTRFGLARAHLASTGRRLPNFDYDVEPVAVHGFAQEKSLGKDTPSGHWEMAGFPVMFEWGYFPPEYPSLPKALTDALIQQACLPGILGNLHASGTEILKTHGLSHMASGKPIIYTSGDSVLQIAAHEESYGLEKLYALCELARKLVDDYQIGRVIARPFVGDSPQTFVRTANRRDYSTPPAEETLLDKLIQANREVHAVGKIADIFAHRGISHQYKADGNMALFDMTLKVMDKAPTGSLVFTNFVDFDSHYGHRRDVAGYAQALNAFDARLPELEKQLLPNDLLIMTADHGCDPTWPGSDHTREHIPVLAYSPNSSPQFIGCRDSFADIGQSVAEHLKIDPLEWGVNFLE